MNRKMLSLTLVFVLESMLVFNWGHIDVSAVDAARVTGPDLYIKDTSADTGAEPNPDPGPMWVTEDIWVRTTADLAYQPYPFPDSGPPPWSTTPDPQPHDNPEYRDPKHSAPNYVYVRVRNGGTAASSGTERLRLYAAKASTGLAWPLQWGGAGIDFMASNCGTPKLYGTEVTKPRKNAATATPAERNAYVQAILNVGVPSSVVATWVVSFWHKQQEVHSQIPSYGHGSRAFAGWHREFINRYEVLLQEADPTVKLLYWDWNTDPENSTGGFNFFDPVSPFMGASGRGTTSGVSIGPPFHPSTGPTIAPPAVTRRLNNGAPPAASDASVLGNTAWGFPASVGGNGFSHFLERQAHNPSHVYIGGSTGFTAIGDMSDVARATKDPFFFLLHGNVDRLWAQWQRDTSVPSALSRLDPLIPYDNESGDISVTTPMRPWDGTGPVIQPWTITGGYIASKNAKHPSIVSPPIYDCAPLIIPVLQPGEAVVLQVPWYPPNPADFSCFGGDQGHFCLLSRIVTGTTVPTPTDPCPEIPSPFGMTTLETADVGANTRNNNNIAWKNVTVVDNFPGALKSSSILVRNVFHESVLMGLRFEQPKGVGASFFDFGRIVVDLKPELFKRWREGNAVGRGIESLATTAGGSAIRISSPEALIQNIRLEPDEVFSVDIRFELSKGYRFPREGLPKWDLIQTGAPGNPNAIVGGQRFVADFNKLVLVKTGDTWRYLDDGSNPGPNWSSENFDDSKWKLGQAELGFGDNPVTSIDGGPPKRRRITTYFRHTFEVTDPTFFQSLLLRLKRDDGAVVYLNGTEIHRVNLPRGTVSPGTLATREVKGIEEEVFFPIPVDLNLLRRGRNIIAVEIHQNFHRSPDLTFDLELSANHALTRFPPHVAFASSTNGSLLQSNQLGSVTIEALDSDGRITSVSLYDNGKLVGTSSKPPYSFQLLRPSRGAHRLRAVAIDNDQQRATADTVITVLANVPPSVSLTLPEDGATFKAGEKVVASAEASDVGGKVRRVDFYLREGGLFTATDKLVGSATAAPYTVKIKRLAPGHYMLTAIATDKDGAMNESIPVHFGVH